MAFIRYYFGDSLACFCTAVENRWKRGGAWLFQGKDWLRSLTLARSRVRIPAKSLFLLLPLSWRSRLATFGASPRSLPGTSRIPPSWPSSSSWGRRGCWSLARWPSFWIGTRRISTKGAKNWTLRRHTPKIRGRDEISGWRVLEPETSATMDNDDDDLNTDLTNTRSDRPSQNRWWITLPGSLPDLLAKPILYQLKAKRCKKMSPISPARLEGKTDRTEEKGGRREKRRGSAHRDRSMTHRRSWPHRSLLSCASLEIQNIFFNYQTI